MQVPFLIIYLDMHNNGVKDELGVIFFPISPLYCTLLELQIQFSNSALYCVSLNSNFNLDYSVTLYHYMSCPQKLPGARM